MFRYFLVRSNIYCIALQLHSDGIASVNSYVEIISSATDLEPENNQIMVKDLPRFDFIITPERTEIANKVRVASCTNTYSFSGLGYVPTGSATSIVFGNTPANSYQSTLMIIMMLKQIEPQ